MVDRMRENRLRWLGYVWRKRKGHEDYERKLLVYIYIFTGIFMQ